MKGQRTSALLWIFWLVFTLLSVPRLYSQIYRDIRTDGTEPEDEARRNMEKTELVSNTLTWCIALVMWILAFFLDENPTYTSSGRSSS